MGAPFSRFRVAAAAAADDCTLRCLLLAALEAPPGFGGPPTPFEGPPTPVPFSSSFLGLMGPPLLVLRLLFVYNLLFLPLPLYELPLLLSAL